MNCFYHSRIVIGTLLAFIGVLPHCDNIPTQCTIDHQARSSITPVTTIPNDIENMEKYFVVLWPEDAQTVRDAATILLASRFYFVLDPCQNIAVPFGVRKLSIAVTIQVTRLLPSRHVPCRQRRRSREPCSVSPGCSFERMFYDLMGNLLVQIWKVRRKGVDRRLFDG